MSFFDGLERFARDVDRFFKGRPEALKLRSCKTCVYYKRGYCTQTPIPTKILSEYYAQGCIFFTTEEPIQEPTPTPKPVTTVQEIEKIVTIRDIIHKRASFIVNSDAEEDFLGWDHTGEISVDSTGTKCYYGSKSWKFPKSELSSLHQIFPIPLGVDWLESFFCYVRASEKDTNCLQVVYFYTDGSNSDQYLQVTVANTFQKKTLTPTAGKKIQYFYFAHADAWIMDTYLDSIFTVF